MLLLGVGTAACQQPRGGGSVLEGQTAPAQGEATPQAGDRPPSAPGQPPSGAPGQAASSTTPEAGREPATREVVIPAGTQLQLVLDTAVGSDTSRTGDPVLAHLLDPVTVDGVVVLPQGSNVEGDVQAVEQSGKVKGRASLSVHFNAVNGPDERRYTMATAPVSRTAQATKGKDALKIGGGAAGGALVGGLIGGKKGAAIGGTAGAGAGTAVVLSTRGEEVRLPRGAALRVRLREPLTVRVPVS